MFSPIRSFDYLYSIEHAHPSVHRSVIVPERSQGQAALGLLPQQQKSSLKMRLFLNLFLSFSCNTHILGIKSLWWPHDSLLKKKILNGLLAGYCPPEVSLSCFQEISPWCHFMHVWDQVSLVFSPLFLLPPQLWLTFVILLFCGEKLQSHAFHSLPAHLPNTHTHWSEGEYHITFWGCPAIPQSATAFTKVLKTKKILWFVTYNCYYI